MFLQKSICQYLKVFDIFHWHWFGNPVEIRRNPSKNQKNVEEPKNPSKPVDAKIFHFFAFFGSLEAGNQNLRIFVSCYSQKHKNISMAFTWKLFGGQPSASSSLARLGADMKVAGAVPLLLVVFKDNLIKLRFCSMCFDWNEHIQFLRKLPYKGYICHAFCSNMWTFCKWMLENGTEQGFQNVVVWNLGKGLHFMAGQGQPLRQPPPPSVAWFPWDLKKHLKDLKRKSNWLW